MCCCITSLPCRFSSWRQHHCQAAQDSPAFTLKLRVFLALTVLPLFMQFTCFLVFSMSFQAYLYTWFSMIWGMFLVRSFCDLWNSSKNSGNVKTVEFGFCSMGCLLDFVFLSSIECTKFLFFLLYPWLSFFRHIAITFYSISNHFFFKWNVMFFLLVID